MKLHKSVINLFIIRLYQQQIGAMVLNVNVIKNAHRNYVMVRQISVRLRIPCAIAPFLFINVMRYQEKI